MSVLTISRDIGSGGLELARLVAESTAYRIADKSVIERVMREYGFVDFDERYDRVGGFWSAEEELTERALSFLDRVIRAIAKADRVVIVGRGGFAPLAGFGDVIHVRATAPFSIRVDRVMRERGIMARADAEQYVQKRDKARRGFVSRYYGTRWEDASPFDLVADVDTFGVEYISEFLSDALRRVDAAPRREPSVLDLNVDSVLMDVALKELKELEEIDSEQEDDD
jgi:cytidylate kinase